MQHDIHEVLLSEFQYQTGQSYHLGLEELIAKFVA